MKIFFTLAIVFSLTGLVACGKINTVDIKKASVAAPTLEYTRTSYTFPLQRLSTTGVPTNSFNSIFQSCTVVPALPLGLSLDSSTCEISGTPTLESSSQYEISATFSNTVLTATLTLVVSEIVPDIAYASNPFQFNLFETSTLGTPTNSGGPIVSCSISPALPLGLALNTSTCEISGAALVLGASNDYSVTAINSAGNSLPYSLSIGVNNVVPDIDFSAASYTFNLNQVSSTTVPSNFGGGITSCAVTPPLPAGLAISQTTCLISGTPNVVTANASYSVTPSNNRGAGASVSIDISISNVVPSITYSAGAYNFDLNNASSNSGVPTNTGGAITACSSDIPLPAGLSINQTSCRISGTPSAVTANATYVITPSNAIGSGNPVSINIVVSNVVPNIIYAGGPYSFNLYASGATTGTPINIGGSITNCVVTPDLPAGLNINTSSCAISGIPTAVHPATSHVVTPSNAVGDGIARTIIIEVANVVPDITYSSSVQIFNINTSSDSGIPSNAGGAITTCTIDPALPAGLTMSQTTCRISGTPTVLSLPQLYDITPSNGIGDGTTISINIRVSNIAPTITYSSGSYNFNLNSAGSTTGTPSTVGGAPTTCSILPALPAGLTISHTTCAISGTPTEVSAAQDYTISPSNAAGPGAQRVINITVSNVVPSINYASDTYTFNMGAAGSTTNAPVNAGGAITGCTISPALPTGLSISPTTCAISGTPGVGRVATDYTITASNAVGSGSGEVINLTVVGITMVINAGPPVGPDAVGAAFYYVPGIPDYVYAPPGSSVTSQATIVLNATEIGFALPGQDHCSLTGGGFYSRYSKNGVLISTTPYHLPVSGDNTYLGWLVTAGVGDTITFDFGCNLVAPSITYPSAAYAYPIGDSGVSTNAENVGGPATSCTITPTLPAGLVVGGDNCNVTGTPTVPTAAQDFTITASNSIGSGAPRTISISVVNAPTISYSTYSYNFIQNTTGSTTGVPTNTGGTITGCSVTPALPAGMSISQTTCEISGTPTEVHSRQHTVTPSNANGSGTPRFIHIRVLDMLPVITYSNTTYNFLFRTPSSTGTPVSSGGPIQSCTINPALPNNVSINSSNCTISGSSIQLRSATDYTVTATNTTGSTTRVISISVDNIVPSVSYPSASYSFTRNLPASTGGVSNVGGAITNCTASTPLPAGLTINPTNCAISGAPSATTPAGSWNITPSNEIGPGATRTISIEVLPLTVYTVNTWDCVGTPQTHYSNCATLANGCYAFTDSGMTNPVATWERLCNVDDGSGTCHVDVGSDAIIDFTTGCGSD